MPGKPISMPLIEGKTNANTKQSFQTTQGPSPQPGPQKISVNPHNIRLGILKKYLERIAFRDPKCKGITHLIRDKMEDVVLSDIECGPEYIKEMEKLKNKQ